MRLPGTEQWNREAVSSRIAFERNVPAASVLLLRETAANNNFANPDAISQWLPSDAIFALGRAAELAFAIEDFDQGFKICEDLLVSEQAAPKTPLQFAFYATMGALLLAFKVKLSFHGADLVREPDAPFRKPEGSVWSRLERVKWPTESSVQTVKLVRLLLPAAVASGGSYEDLEATPERREGGLIKPSATAVILGSPEFEALGAWQGGHSSYERLARAMEVLEAEYARQLEVLRSDLFYWRSLRPRGSIIDWGLLAIWVSMLRFEREGIDLQTMPVRSEEAAYIRFLAGGFVNHTRDRIRRDMQ
jgi:hypothetical protein